MPVITFPTLNKEPKEDLKEDLEDYHSFDPDFRDVADRIEARCFYNLLKSALPIKIQFMTQGPGEMLPLYTPRWTTLLGFNPEFVTEGVQWVPTTDIMSPVLTFEEKEGFIFNLSNIELTSSGEVTTIGISLLPEDFTWPSLFIRLRNPITLRRGDVMRIESGAFFVNNFID